MSFSQKNANAGNFYVIMDDGGPAVNAVQCSTSKMLLRYLTTILQSRVVVVVVIVVVILTNYPASCKYEQVIGRRSLLYCWHIKGEERSLI